MLNVLVMNLITFTFEKNQKVSRVSITNYFQLNENVIIYKGRLLTPIITIAMTTLTMCSNLKITWLLQSS